MRPSRTDLRLVLPFVSSLLLLPLSSAPLVAQLGPPSTGGVPALMRELSKLGHYQRVLMIGAHPDDEDTELLTILSRGEGAETAYLSLTRGEGGQDLIGPELGDALGILRTEELLAARRIDGSQQFFTRAYDFGFSKTIDDAWKHWPQDSVLKDVVRIIRRFRPQVVVSVFSGTPADGHGQHQVAGWAAKRAFEVAGDSTVFPELKTEEGLEPWTPLKLYRSARFNPAATMLTFDGGAIDPVTGKTYRQLAMEGRSLHRSQKMGQLQPIGPSSSRVTLWEDRTGKGSDGFWAGVDTSVDGYPPVPGLPPAAQARVKEMLRRYASQIAALKAGFPYASPAGAVPQIEAAASTLASVTSAIRAAAPDRCQGRCIGSNGPASQELQGERDHLTRLQLISSGVVLDAIASDQRVVAGDRVAVTLLLRNGGTRALRVPLGVSAQEGFTAAVRDIGDASLPPGALAADTLSVTASEGSVPTQPYFLSSPRNGWLYTWPEAAIADWGMPFGATGLSAWAGDPAALQREVTYRTNDPATGEIRRPVFIVPRVSVKLTPEETLLPLGRGSVTFTVTLEHGAHDTTTGVVRLELPDGWQKPEPQRFTLSRPDEQLTLTFNVRPPVDAKTGTATVRAVAVDSKGARYEVGTFLVDYPHIHPRQYTEPAEARVVLADATLPPIRAIGYVRGAADHEPEALIAAGLPVTILDSATLASGDLSKFDAIVIGPRAYEIDTTLIDHNDRLLAYARDGGRVMVQYQQQVFFAGGFAPYPLSLGGRNDRTTDETAPVTVLAPESPDVRSPNLIGPADWDGWLQERSLYCAHTWDSNYQPILSMADPGEAPIQGCLLEAKVGRGSWAYNALAFHRQLPGAVPGAFRLFVDLLGARPRP
ncbi:MAG TPA: PIG-L family deacetylase [Gemmatimonadales bacterium]|nr:PIG-L family deacetylase [Gemmatimonadales bacterium]